MSTRELSTRTSQPLLRKWDNDSALAMKLPDVTNETSPISEGLVSVESLRAVKILQT